VGAGNADQFWRVAGSLVLSVWSGCAGRIGGL
jgi:hypothetical protein